MKKLIWKLRFAFRLIHILKISFRMTLQSAESSLEMVRYDMENFDPIEMADDEIYYWISDLE